jgi:hypothetical protein
MMLFAQTHLNLPAQSSLRPPALRGGAAQERVPSLSSLQGGEGGGEVGACARVSP